MDHKENSFGAIDGKWRRKNWAFWFRENKKSVILLKHSGFMVLVAKNMATG